jgi:hypothetical protein
MVDWPSIATAGLSSGALILSRQKPSSALVELARVVFLLLGFSVIVDLKVHPQILLVLVREPIWEPCMFWVEKIQFDLKEKIAWLWLGFSD